jgi:hypothetical protein
LLGEYDRYAAFFCCLTFAQRARCAAAILLRPARLIVRTGASTDRFVFAHRAFWASEIFLRAAADNVRFDLFGFIRIPVRFRPTKFPSTWITWSSRLRSCSSSFNTPARFAMVFPLMFVWNNCAVHTTHLDLSLGTEPSGDTRYLKSIVEVHCGGLAIQINPHRKKFRPKESHRD